VDLAKALGIEVGEVASSIVFGLPGDAEPTPLLFTTTERHCVDTHLVAQFLNVERLLPADADLCAHVIGLVNRWSQFCGFCNAIH
jgi:hypothetical protein